MKEITIIAPDDWHLHLRDGDILNETVAATARCFRRAIIMPNLVPPVKTAQAALDYRQRIMAAVPQGMSFEPLMTLFLSNETSRDDIIAAKNAGVVAAKLYPAGATTNSAAAVKAIDALDTVFETMSDVGMLLLIHGEVTSDNIDIFDREKAFIDQHLERIHQRFDKLKIVFEHITTTEAVDFVLQAQNTLAATITPQHLLLNRNDLLVGGIHPHNYCLPVLKRNTHQQSLRKAVASGSPKFFLGSDSAPHSKQAKEAACGCAGCYSALGALELYTQVFDELGALDKLEGFASLHGPDFYGLARNQQKVTLRKEAWTLPEQIELDGQPSIVPFFAGQELAWKLLN